jgi:hypothetical protein
MLYTAHIELSDGSQTDRQIDAQGIRSASSKAKETLREGETLRGVTEATTMKVYLQMTTGKLHRTHGCGVTSRTRYAHTVKELSTTEVAASLKKCQRCFG